MLRGSHGDLQTLPGWLSSGSGAGTLTVVSKLARLAFRVEPKSS
jgi:hypothetical protein